MAIKPLNSVGGFSVGLPAKNIIDSNGNITTTSANLTGNLSAGTGNLSFDSTTNILSVLGNIVSTNANLGNLVTANYFAGVLTTAQQPNITSVGNLTGLKVTGLTSLGNVGNVAITGGTSGYVLKTDGLGNLSWTDPTAAGVAGSNTQVQFNNNGSFGSSANFTFDNGTNTLTANLITATITAASNSQPNITSVGSLTSLSVVGTATVGNVSTGGTVSATGNIQGGNLSTAGQVQSATVSASGNVQGGNLSTTGIVEAGTASVTGTANVGNLETTGFISATGNIQGGNLSTAGLLSAGTASVSGNANIGNINTGAISATGNISAANFIGNLYGNFYGNVDAAGANTQVQFAGANDQLDASTGFTFDKSSNAMAVSGTATVGNLSTTGTVSATGTATVGNLSTGGTVSATGTATVGNVSTGGTVSATGTATVGNLSTGGTVSATGTATVGNLSTGGTVSATGTATVGNLSTGGTVSATGTATVGNLTTTGLITGGNVTTTGAVSAGKLTVSGVSSLGNVGNVGITGGTSGQFLQTDGLGNLSFATVGTAGIANGSSNVDIPVSNGNVNVSVGGVSNVFVVTSTGVNVAGTMSASGNAAIGGNLSTTGNITVGSGTGGTISGANLVSANYITGTLTTAAQPNITSVGSLASLSVVGTATVGNLDTTGYANAGTLSVSGNANVGNIGAGVGSFSSGVTAANLTSNNLTNGRVTFTTGGVLSDASSFTFATGNGLVTANAFSGNGSLLSNVAANTAITVTASAQPNITSVGNLTSLVVIGTANVGNLETTGFISATGNIQGGNLSTAGLMTAGNITTAGSVSAGTMSATGNIKGGNLSTTGSVTTATLSATGNVSVGNLSTGAISATGTITSDTGLISNSLTAFANTAVTVSAGAGTGDNNVILLPTGANGAVSASGTRIISVGYPSADTDAASKLYVDTVAQGLNVHQAAYAGTTGNLNVATGGTVAYLQPNGAGNGVGATLTVVGGSFDLIDGANVQTVGTRILVKNEGNAAWNGVYTWANATVIVRATDEDQGADFDGGDFLFITAGNTLADTGWVQTTNAVVVGTSPIVFQQFSGAGAYTANTSAGLELIGSVFNAKVDANSNPTIGFDSNGNLHVPSNARFITPNIDAATGTSLSVSGNITAAAFFGPLTNGTSNVYIPASNGNVNITANGATSLVVTGTGANIAGNLGVTGTVTATAFYGNVSGNVSGNITIPGANTQVVYVDGNGFANSSAAFTFNNASNVVTVSSVLAVTANTKITGATITTSSVTTLPIATFPKADVTGVEYIVKGVSAGGAYSMATVQAITDGSNVDYAIFGTLALGGATFSDLSVVINASNIELQVTPASASNTVWTTQYRLI